MIYVKVSINYLVTLEKVIELILVKLIDGEVNIFVKNLLLNFFFISFANSKVFYI